MNFIRKIIDIDDLSNIISIPEELKHKKVEIFILPVEDKKENAEVFNPDEFSGVLNLKSEEINQEIDNMRNEWDRF